MAGNRYLSGLILKLLKERIK